MSIDAAHKRWWQTGDMVFGLPLLAAIALQWAVPLFLPRGIFTPARIVGGAALIVVGVTLILRARREFTRHGQPTDPGLPTSRVVTTGVFSFSRHPIYLGALCFVLGLALAVNIPWAIVLLLPAVVACHYILIVPEERYLAVRFGDDYHTYAASVHRWIGRVRQGG